MSYKITALRIQKRNRQRVNVYLDGEFAFGLARIVCAWLQVGQEISDDKIAQLKAEDARETAYQRAIKFISYRPRSEAEIRQNLEEHEVSEMDIDAIVKRLQDSGVVDDVQFARMWVENRSEMRPRGRRALAYELRKRGIADFIIEDTLEAVDEEQMAYRAAQQRAYRFRKLEWQDFRKKMYSYLAQRGFNYATAAPVIASVWAEVCGTDHPIDEEEYP